MAVYFRHTCGTCGGLVVNDENSKSYVHASRNWGGHSVENVVTKNLGSD